MKQSHEVQATLAEYMRELTHAIGHLDFDVTGNRVTVRDGERRVLIDLVYEGSRHLGSLNLPVMRVDYEFVGYGEEEMNASIEAPQYPHPAPWRLASRSGATGG